MVIDPEAFRQRCLAQEGFSVEDRKELQKLLRLGWFQRMMKELADEADGQRRSFTNMDMTTEEGVKKALGTQGRVRGLDRAFDLVVELAQDSEEEDDESDGN
jgi:hypothetical protein